MNNTLNISMFGHKRIPSREGGIEVVVEELSTIMVKCGHKVCCYKRKGQHVSGAEFKCETKDDYKGITIKNVFTIDKKGLAAVTSSFFASILSAIGKYNVVHIHAEGPAAFCWLPKLFGKKVIVTVHGLDHQRAKWGKFASAYIMLGEKNAVKFADDIIVLSQSVQQYFMDTYGRETIFIPNGVNRMKTIEASLIKDEFGIEKNDYILYLGRLVPEKGIRYLIEAYKNINTDKKLVIAGGSSDTDIFKYELETMAAGDDRIIFTGFVQGRLLEELYSNAYIYVLPSDLEGMPLSLLEAMSYSNCCLTSDIEECASVVEDKAVIFKKSNIEDLTNKLQKLCNSEEIVEFYKNSAADYICEKYNWDYVVNQTLILYKG